MKKTHPLILIIFLATFLSPSILFSQEKHVEIVDVHLEQDAEDSSLLEEDLGGVWSADVDSFERKIMHEMEDSFQTMRRLREHLNQLFTDEFMYFSTDFFDSFDNENIGYAYEELDDKIVLVYSLPGVQNGEIDIQVFQGRVRLTGTQRSETQQANDSEGSSFHFQSTSMNTFIKEIPLHPMAKPQGYDLEVGDDHIILTFDKK